MSEAIKQLSQHDVKEIVKFQEYLADMQTMPKVDFYCKYQEYLGLSGEELKQVNQPR